MAESLSIFIFLFLSALPGRTTFLLILLAANGKASQILWGAGLAFFVQSFISVLAGGALAFIPTPYIDIGAGILFLFFAIKMWREARVRDENLKLSRSGGAVFGLVFMAELGDVSQIAIATAASRASSKFLVFVLAVAALWLITVLAVMLGRRGALMVEPKLMQKIAAVLFLLIGLYGCVKGTLLLSS